MKIFGEEKYSMSRGEKKQRGISHARDKQMDGRQRKIKQWSGRPESAK